MDKLINNKIKRLEKEVKKLKKERLCFYLVLLIILFIEIYNTI